MPGPRASTWLAGLSSLLMLRGLSARNRFCRLDCRSLNGQSLFSAADFNALLARQGLTAIVVPGQAPTAPECGGITAGSRRR